MKIKLHNGRRASDSDVFLLEKKIGTSLNRQFLEFVEAYDGAVVESNHFKVNSKFGAAVSSFIPLNEIFEKTIQLADLPKNLIPIALAEGGNYILLSTFGDGAVYFWDHEIENGVDKIADSFGSFLDMLEPFNSDSIEIKPGQVLESWIDPDFLKSLEEDTK